MKWMMLFFVAGSAWAGTGTVPLQEMKTFCNPLNIDYRFAGPRHREAADPVIIRYRDDYYLFASKCGGYYWSSDMKVWHFVKPRYDTGTMTEAAIEEYAPAAMVYNDRLYYMVCREGSIYGTSDPKSGIWDSASFLRKGIVDPGFFVDDDNRVYLYHGCFRIRGFELKLDEQGNWVQAGDEIFLFTHDHHNRGAECWGDNNELKRDDPTYKPWTEGAWMTKHNGRYYLQTSVPGTTWNSYCDLAAVSDEPLGTFTYADYSPIALQSTGFAPGAGHGGEFTDKRGVHWRVDTGVISLLGGFERRINMWRSGFDSDGTMFTDTYLGSYPQFLPYEDNGDALSSNLAGWMLLSYGKPASASSTMKLYPVENAFDENIKTIWAADRVGNTGDPLSGSLLVEGAWRAEYFMNSNLEGVPPLTREDPVIDFLWNGEPAPEFGADNFSVRWTGTLKAPHSGEYSFGVTSDDGARLFIGGERVFDDWTRHGPQRAVVKKELTAGQEYAVVLEFFEGAGAARVLLDWKPPSDEGKTKLTGSWLAVDLEQPCQVAAVQVNPGEVNASNVDKSRDGAFRYIIEHSMDGQNWSMTVDKSKVTADVPHDYMELVEPVTARYFRISEVETPYNAHFSMRDFRLFGKAPGKVPAEISGLVAKRDPEDARNVTVSWKPSAGAEGYVIRYGTAPDKLYNSYMVRGRESFRINSLNTGAGYWFSVDSFNPSGIRRGRQRVRILAR